jgi:hypothetical protein
LLRYLAGDFGRGDIDFRNLYLANRIRQHHPRGPESVGLDHVASHAKKIGMDVSNNVGTAQNQELVAAFFAPEIISGRKRN